MTPIVPSEPTAKPRRARRWLVRVVILVLLFVCGYVGFCFWQNARDRRDWQEACAEADALDPGWRYEPLAASLPSIPDEQNSVTHLRAAANLIPNWAGLGIRDPRLNNELRKTRAEIRYSPPVVAGLRELLAAEANAVAAA